MDRLWFVLFLLVTSSAAKAEADASRWLEFIKLSFECPAKAIDHVAATRIVVTYNFVGDEKTFEVRKKLDFYQVGDTPGVLEDTATGSVRASFSDLRSIERYNGDVRITCKGNKRCITETSFSKLVKKTMSSRVVMSDFSICSRESETDLIDAVRELIRRSTSQKRK